MYKKSIPNNQDVIRFSILIILTIITGILYFSNLLDIPFKFWNGARLAYSASILKGYRLYYPENAGPVSACIYGPVSALYWIPTMLFNTVRNQLIAGGLFSIFISLGPVLLLIFRFSIRPTEDTLFSIIIFLFTALGMLMLYSTQYIVTIVSIDSIALGLSLASSLFLMQQYSPPKIIHIIFASLLAVLSVWAKQNLIYLFFAHFIFLSITYGKRTVLQYLCCSLLIGVIISLIFLLIFNEGDNALLFNMFQVPKSHPFKYHPTQFNGYTIFFVVLSYLLQMTLAILFMWYLHLKATTVKSKKNIKLLFLNNNWILILIIAISSFPTSMLGYLKVGGDVNSLHFYYYLITALSIVVIKMESIATKEKQGLKNSQLFLGLICFLMIFAVDDEYGKIKNRITTFKTNHSGQVLKFLKQHRNAAYFPSYPLEHLSIDNKLFHFSYGIFDRYLAGYPISDQHLRAHIPHEFKYLIFREERIHLPFVKKVLKYFPEYSKKITLIELPGWAVFKKPS